MTEPSQLQRIQNGDLFTEDFVVACAAPRAVTKGQPCTTPARWATEMHLCGQCNHPALNDAGNIERFVCDQHLESLEAEAERTARKYRRQPFWVRWWRGDADMRCQSCNSLILHPGDILQIVVAI